MSENTGTIVKLQNKPKKKRIEDNKIGKQKAKHSKFGKWPPEGVTVVGGKAAKTIPMDFW